MNLAESESGASSAYPLPDREGMLKALQALIDPEDVVELRAFHKGKKRIVCGYFDSSHWSDLVDNAERLSRMGASVYVTINSVDPQLLGRYHNRVQDYADKTTSDKDIERRRWFLIDVDPTRPADTSSTDAQNEAAFLHAQVIFRELKVRGWPAPVVARSGNGMHLLFAIDLPNDGDTTSLLKAVLGGLASLFDVPGLKVDQSVFNAARICKLWGTVATKGDHTAQAPHRLSELQFVPPERRPVTVEQLQAIAALAPTKGTFGSPSTPARASLRPAGEFSVETFLATNGLEFVADQHNGADRFKLAHCPFNAEHVNGEAAVFRALDGVLGFKCQHDSCQDKRWRDVRELFDGPQPSRRGPVESQIDIDVAMAAQRKRIEAQTPAESHAVPGGVTPLESGSAGEDGGLSGLSHAPVFDYGMCPGILGEFIRSETEFSEAPPIGILANITTRLSADLGRTAFIRLGHQRLHPRLYWVCAGPSGAGRKGTAAKIAEAAQRAAFAWQDPDGTSDASADRHTLPPEAEGMLPARSLTSLSTGEGLINQVRTTVRREDAANFKPPGLVDNRLFVDSQEFSGTLKKSTGKDSTLSQTIREAYDGTKLSNSSITNAMEAENPHIVINASVPVEELVKLLSSDAAVEVSNGLMNRFITTYQTRTKILANPKEGKPWIMAQFAEAYRRAMITSRGGDHRYEVGAESSIEITFTGLAQACLDDWYLLSQTETRSSLLNAMLVRSGVVLRAYSALLALLRGSLVIEVEDIEAAKLLVRYWRDSLEFIFSQGQQTAEAQRLHDDARSLLKALPVGVPVPMTRFKDTWTVPRRRKALDYAQRTSPAMATLSRVQRPGGGRPIEYVTRCQ